MSLLRLTCEHILYTYSQENPILSLEIYIYIYIKADIKIVSLSAKSKSKNFFFVVRDMSIISQLKEERKKEFLCRERKETPPLVYLWYGKLLEFSER